MTPRLEVVDLRADGSRLIARCRLCGGELSRETSSSDWNLWDLWDALGDHVAVNHPADVATHLAVEG